MMMQRTIAEVLAAQAAKHPEREFLLEHRGDRLRSVCFASVEKHVQEFAGGMAARGLSPGDRAVLTGENCSEWVISFLGILRAGAVPVPVHHELGHSELRGLLQAAEARLVIGSSKSLDSSADLGVPILRWRDGEDLDASLRDIATGEPAPMISSDAGDLAVLLFTSGTTGRPKGVMLSHRNLLSNVQAFTSLASVSSGDRLLLVLPMHHAFPLTAGLLGTMSLGASLALEPDVRRTADRMAEMRPTIFFGVPALYDTMLRAVQQRVDRERGPGAFKRLTRRLGAIKRVTGFNVAPLILRPLHRRLGGRIRFLASGGAPLHPDTHRAFLRLGMPLLQGYGLTEASPVCAAQPYSLPRFLFTKYYERLAGSVGLAVPGVTLQLADLPELGIRAEAGGEGELLVKGPNVMMGYFRDEESTSAVIKDGWLRTGDLARIDRDGNVYITGRAKDVIVLDSGENIHPEEIEDILAPSPLVADACLMGGPKHRGLTLIIHPDAEGAGLPADVAANREALRAAVHREVSERLAGVARYKRPSQLVISPEPLPRTLLGKVKRFEVHARRMV
jgi:long-chain acyl-CoA synthetase